MSLPLLHLRTANLSGPWVEKLGDSLDVVLDDDATKYMWVDLQEEMKKDDVSLAMSTPWWEIAANEGNGVLPFVVSTPMYMTEAQYLTFVAHGGTPTGTPIPPVVRSNYKWLATLYRDPTDTANRFTRKYMGEFGPADFTPEGQRRCFSGEFQIVDPIKMIVDWHTRPLSYFGMMIATEQENGDYRPPSPEIYGPLAQNGREVRAGTPAPVEQVKVPYMCVIGIDAICGNKRVRMCGSMYYYDAVDQPYEHKAVVKALMQTCPYYDIGREMAGAPGSRVYGDSLMRFYFSRS